MNKRINEEFRNMFREYDVRGRVNEKELNPENVRLIVSAYAMLLLKRGITSAVVGYDNRECSPSFADAAVKALSEAGVEVYFVGLGITPLVYYAQYLYKCQGGVMITASHNPSDWSGFKFAKGYSKTLESHDIRELFDIVMNIDANYTPAKKPAAVHTVNARDSYVSEIVSRINMGAKPPKIVIDAGNGGAGLFAYEVFHKLGCLTFQLNCDPDITYPHYFPNPSNLKARESLRALVTHPYINADVGIGFDGDGDRIGVIDEKGNDIWSDTLLAVLSKQLLEKKKNATIVYDVKCSKSLEEVISENGGNPVMWKTGHSYIKAKMHELSAELAGERSGHIFVGGDDYFGFDDAVFVAAKLVEYLSHREETLSELIASFPAYVTSPEIKTNCGDSVKYSVIEKVLDEFKSGGYDVNDICGARVSFEHGWGLVRASSNLPELVIIFEADTLEHLLEIRAVFKEKLGKYPEIDPHWENDIY